MKIGITRVRNEEGIIGQTLDRLSGVLDGVVVYDDRSTDHTVEECLAHPLVLHVEKGKRWSPEPHIRKLQETTHRQFVHDFTLTRFRPEWMLYFDADEHIYFNDIDWNTKDSYYFRLWDVYITPDDVNKHYLERDKIGVEYRDITMLFRPPATFYNRIPRGVGMPQYGGDVKHFGKGISVSHWEETCDYYINHLNETLSTGETIAERWSKRKGKAIHTLSDFGSKLIKWDERHEKGIKNIY